jgi:hypothetical protein
MNSAELDVHPMWWEAAAVAILGCYCAMSQAITLARITAVGDPAPISGRWVFPRGLP